MGEAQKHWTKQYFLTRLEQIDKLVSEIDKVAIEGGKIPARLRTRVRNESARISSLNKDLRAWAVTPKEKLEKRVRKGGE